MSERSLTSAQAAKEKLKQLVGNDRTINGIGISKDEQGYFIKINLSRDSSAEFPEEVDGIPVAVENVGRISPQAS